MEIKEESKNNRFPPFQGVRDYLATKNMNREELARYHYEKRMYAKENSIKQVTNLKVRKAIFYPILGALKLLYRGFLGEKVEVLKDSRYDHPKYTNRPKIFVPMHIGDDDIQTVYRVIKEHMVLLLGDPGPYYNGVIGRALAISGAVYMETDEEKFPGDRKLAYDTCLETINDGGNLLLFAEGAYNISYEDTATLVMKLYNGATRLALESDKDPLIVPISLDKKGKKTKVIISKPIDLSVIPKEEADKTMIRELTDNLRDVLATGKYEIIESEGVFKRESVSYAQWWKSIDQLLDKSSEIGSREEVLAEIERTRYKDKNIDDPKEVLGENTFPYIYPPPPKRPQKIKTLKPLNETLRLIKERSK